MVSNTQDNGPDDFEDEVFDEAEFSEEAYDEAAFDETEFSDMEEGDAEFADEDFVDEEWEEEPLSAKKGREKSLYKTGEKKGLSFNTIVIIGAVVVGGGVMAMTVMNESAEVAAGNKNSFLSMLGISGVMDGTLFGEEKAEPTQEELAEQDKKNQEEGFLNNPDVLNGTQNPPQPAPIAPAEQAVDATGAPLVPLSEGYGGTPRGPEDGIPENQVAISETPIQPITPEPEVQSPSRVSAEDILKQAIANREKKQEEANAPTPSPVVENKPVEPSPEIAAVPAPQPVPVQPVTSPAQIAANAEALAANTKAMEALGSRIEDMMNRIQKIETDLGAVRDTKSNDYQQLEQTLSSLKQDVQTLRDRPATAPAPIKTAVAEPETRPEPAEAVTPVKAPSTPKKTVKKTAAQPKKAATAKAPAATVAQWELRAAQPGRAWISKPGARDMQGVQVGQTLPGIGRVTAITYQNGRWAIIGSQGQIRQ